MHNIKKQSRFTISTLNLFNYLKPPNAYYQHDNIYTNKEWQRKTAWLDSCIMNLDSDIIAFQEVFSPNELREQVSKLGYRHFACLDKPHIEHGYQYRSPVLALASRFPITKTQLLFPDDSLTKSGIITKEFEFSRVPLMVSINLELLGDINFVVVHFKSQRAMLTHSIDSIEESEAIRSWLSTSQRGFEANILYYQLNKLKKESNQPVIILGDFNQTINSHEFNGFFSVESTLDNDRTSLRFFDSWDLYCDQFDSANLQWSRPASHYYGAVGKVLDYILLSNEFAHDHTGYLTVYDYRTYDEHLLNPIFNIDHLSSDHAAITIEIGLQ